MEENQDKPQEFASLIDDTESSNVVGTTPTQTTVSETAFTEKQADKPSRKRSKGLLIGLIALALIVAGSIGAVFAYQNIYLSPERILAQTIENMSEVESYEFDADFTFSAKLGDSSLESIFFPTTFGVKAQGYIEFPDLENSKSKINMDINTNNTSVANIDAITIGTSNYLKLNSLIDTGFIDVSPILNMWIEIDENSFSSIAGTSEEIFNEDNQSRDFQKLVELITENNPLTITESLDQVEINGQAMHHYSYDIEKDKLKTFLLQYVSYYEDVYGIDYGTLTDQELEEAFAAIQTISGEIWVGRTDKLLHKFTLLMNIVNPEGQGLDSITYNMTVNLKNFNQKQVVETPTQTITIEKAVQEVLQLYLPEGENLEDYNQPGFLPSSF